MMSGGKYPTLSSSLYTYVWLMSYVEELLEDEFAENREDLKNGLRACKAKLETYFDRSTRESELYFFATGENPFTTLFVL